MQLDCIMMQCSRSAALITYDYLLTVRREANLFWRQNISAASVLFFVNRYLALIYYVALAYYRGLLLPYPVSRFQLVSLVYSRLVVGVRRYKIEP